MNDQDDDDYNKDDDGSMSHTPTSFADLIPRLNATSSSFQRRRRKRRRRKRQIEETPIIEQLQRGETPMTPASLLFSPSSHNTYNNNNNSPCNLTQCLQKESFMTQPEHHGVTFSFNNDNNNDDTNQTRPIDKPLPNDIFEASPLSNSNPTNSNDDDNYPNRLKQNDSQEWNSNKQNETSKQTSTILNNTLDTHNNNTMATNKSSISKTLDPNLHHYPSSNLFLENEEDGNSQNSHSKIDRNDNDIKDIHETTTVENHPLSLSSFSSTPPASTVNDHLPSCDDSQDRKEEEEEEENFFVGISVWNVVVDYTMQLPTPLELEEFQFMSHQHHNNNHTNITSIMVPVLRIFGPMASYGYSHRQHNNNNNRMSQSSCLYIHGAYPYILARPIQAGPDIDIITTSISKEKEEQKKWNNETYIESIMEEMQDELENLLQDSFHHNDNEGDDPKKAKNETFMMIRQLEIVYGRGFYTYCSGPPAPFIRVEYYNPQHRWRIKLLLERGISFAENPKHLVKFQCYEAHIPYTMQVFKDNHLSGLSPIHIIDGRFRHELPIGPRPYKNQINKQKQQQSSTTSSSSLLTRHTIPNSWTWPRNPPKDTFQDTNQRKGKTTWPFECYWTKKESSCDLELDTTIDHLKNRDNKNQTWRAVPSLQDVWLQEYNRMCQLLSPSEYFIPPQLDLENKSSSRSGAKLALKGANQLFANNPSLKDDYQKAMKDILQRHEPFLDQIDQSNKLKLEQKLRKNNNQPKEEKMAIAESFPLSQAFLTHPSNDSDDDDDGDALNKLMELFETNISTSDSQTNKVDEIALSQISSTSSALSIHYYPAVQNSNHNPISEAKHESKKDDEDKPESDEVNYSIPHKPLLFTPNKRQSDDTFTPQRSSCESHNKTKTMLVARRSTPINLLRNDAEAKRTGKRMMTMTPEEKRFVEENVSSFGKIVDRGENVILSQKQVYDDVPFLEDFIDPNTLTPYNNDDDENEEEEMSEEALEKSLSILQRQSPKNTAAKHDREKGTTSPKTNSENNSHTHESSRDPKRKLTFSNEDEGHSDINNCSQGTNQSIDVITKIENIYHKTIMGSMYHNGVESSSPQQHSNNEEIIPHQTMNFSSSPSSSDHVLSNEQCYTLEPQNLHQPPNRDTVLKGDSTTQFHSFHSSISQNVALKFKKGYEKIEDEFLQPSWLGYSYDFNEFHRQTFSSKDETMPYVSFFDYFKKCHIDKFSNSFLEPVRERPPSSRAVKSWVKKKRMKKRKKIIIENNDPSNAQRRSSNIVKDKSLAAVSVPRSNRKVKFDIDDQNNEKNLGSKNVSQSQQTRKRLDFVNEANEGKVEVAIPQRVDMMGHDPPKFDNDLQMRDSISPKQDRSHQLSLSHEKKPKTSPVRLDSTTEGTQLTVESTIEPRSGSYVSQDKNPIPDPLEGIGQQGGRIHVQGGGDLKTSNISKGENTSYDASSSDQIRHQDLCSLSIMSIEIHVQCRTGKASAKGLKQIAMKPDFSRDAIFAVVYIYAIDPGGGEKINIIERGAIFIPTEAELSSYEKNKTFSCENNASDLQKKDIQIPNIGKTMGIASQTTMEFAKNENHLLLRLASIIQCRDPDILVSWDTQVSSITDSEGCLMTIYLFYLCELHRNYT